MHYGYGPKNVDIANTMFPYSLILQQFFVLKWCRHNTLLVVRLQSLQALSRCIITTVLLFKSADNCFCQGDKPGASRSEQPGPQTPPPGLRSWRSAVPTTAAGEIITTKESKHVPHPGAGSARRLKAAASSIIHADRPPLPLTPAATAPPDWAAPTVLLDAGLRDLT